MMKNVRTTVWVIVAVLLACSSVAQALTVDWVPVGNAGNANDDTGYGNVSYDYNISRYEITAGQYAEFLNTVAKTDSHVLHQLSMTRNRFGCQILKTSSNGISTYTVEPDWADRPVNFVGWHDAMRFCNWLHNGQGAGDTEDGAYDMSLGLDIVRKEGAKVWLPNENEWYKAAYHKNDGVTGNYFDYPTSSDTAPGRDMTETTNPGNNANYWDEDDGFLIGEPYYRTEVGEFELSDSPYGTFDMGGNAFEWIETKIDGHSRGIRGGSWNHNDYILGSSYRLSYYSPDGGDYTIGFRVASVPEPCSLVLLGLGGLMLRRKYRR